MEQAQTYKDAGVDLEAASQVVRLIKQQARSTLRPEVLSGVGFFGGLFKLGAYKEPVLVSSADGVGTKLKIAAILGKYDTVGIDLVNHCVNDILTSGAEPLFFLDYIAMGRLIPRRVEEIIKGIYEVLKDVKRMGRLPVVNFAAGGIATPADAAFMMFLGADGVFVGSGIFKSSNPPEYARAIVEAVENWKNAEIVAEASKGLGEPMKGQEIDKLEEKLQIRGL